MTKKYKVKDMICNEAPVEYQAETPFEAAYEAALDNIDAYIDNNDGEQLGLTQLGYTVEDDAGEDLGTWEFLYDPKAPRCVTSEGGKKHDIHPDWESVRVMAGCGRIEKTERCTRCGTERVSTLVGTETFYEYPSSISK